MIRKIIKFLFSVQNDKRGQKFIQISGIKFPLNSVIFELKQIQAFQRLTTDITKVPKAAGILRLIQEADAILLHIITKLCEQNNLTYWINYGTLLGAVRHKGFIPWDDDLDICMLRDDYEKLIAIIDNLFKGQRFEYSITDCLRIYYKNTPIQLDIFPLDYYYKNIETEKEEKELFKKIGKAKKYIKYYKKRTGIPNFGVKNSYEEIKKLRDEIVMENNMPDKNASMFRAIETKVWHLSYYKRDWIFPLQRIEFEGKKYFAPNKISTVLFENYGDYMKFPPSMTKLHKDIQKRITPSTIANIEKFIETYKEVLK